MGKQKNKQPGIVAVFRYLDDFTDTLKNVRNRSDFDGHEALAPTSYHSIMEIAEEKYGYSEVRWFTLVGALTGIMTGFGMPLWMDYDWPIVVGGKTAGFPSVTAYVVLGFELMVLFGALCTILGMLVMGRLPNPYARVYDRRTTDDHFAIFVPKATLEGEQAKVLRECGANEIFQTK